MHIESTHLPKMNLKLKKGALHKELHIADGKKIALKELQKAKRSANSLTRKRATFALNARHWHRKGK